MKQTHFIILLGILAALALFIVSACSSSSGKVDKQFLKQYTAEVYYSQSCGCCMNYLGHLRESGFTVKDNQMQDLASVRETFNIPASAQGCHVSKVGKYFVEGMVPAEAIEKLLREQPDIDGIALPGMPEGVPGMPGTRTYKLDVVAVKDGEVTGTFMQV